jgi:hypothetical protein
MRLWTRYIDKCGLLGLKRGTHAERTTYKTFDKIYEINSKNTFTRGMGTLGTTQGTHENLYEQDMKHLK